jgi:hypothetical protein
MTCGFTDEWRWSVPISGIPGGLSIPGPVNTYPCDLAATGWRFCEDCGTYHPACDRHCAEMTLAT